MAELGMSASQNYVSRIIDDGQVSGQQVLVVILCFFFNTLDGFDITAMAVVANSVAGELVLSADRLGWIFSFALIGMMGGAMLLAPVADLVGRRRLVVLSLLLIGVSVLLTASASSLGEFIVLRLIAGLGVGAMLASQATLAAEYSPERFKALSVAIAVSGYPAGAMTTSVIAGIVMPQYGWRGMFWFGGAVTLLLAAVAWLKLPESLKFLLEKRPAGALEHVNRILARLGKSRLDALPELTTKGEGSTAGVAATIRKLLAREHRATTLTLWAAFLMAFATLYFLMSWIPKLMEDAGFSVADGRQAFFLFNLGALVGIYLLGYLSTHWRLTDVIALFAGASAVGMAVFAVAPHKLILLLPIIFLVGVLQQGGFTGLYSAAAKAYPTSVRSTGVGWAIGLGRTGAVIGPAVAGSLIVGGLDIYANFIVFAVPMALSALFAWRLGIR